MNDVFEIAYQALFVPQALDAAEHEQSFEKIEAEMLATLAEMPVESLPRC